VRAPAQILLDVVHMIDIDHSGMQLIAIVGSLRQRSYNGMLARAATEMAPPGVGVEIASIADVPLYNEDVEASGMPPAVAVVKDAVARADGLLLVSPEYNDSIPGVLKNAIDWLSRPARDIARVFANLPVAVIGATPGHGGTSLAQAAWLPTLRTLGTLPYFGARVLLSRADRAFATDGRLTDLDARARLATFMAGFAAFAARHGRSSVATSR
jgi:chromate reductase, NAD(P)H dehydrogenase (quinone)